MLDIKFLLIMPVFNASKYLNETLDSILCQSYENFELLAVNDASTDDSLEILKCYAKKDSRIKIINSSFNLGVSAARNLALAKLKNYSDVTHVSFVDSDDLLSENFLDDFVKCFKRDPSIQYAICSIALLTKKGVVDVARGPFCSLKLDNRNAFYQIAEIGNWRKFGYQHWGVLNKVFKKELLQEERFDDYIRMGEDLIFLLRVLKKVNKGVCFNHNNYIYRIRSSSATHTPKVSYIPTLEELHLLLKQNEDSNLRTVYEKIFAENILSMYPRAILYGITKDISIIEKRFLPLVKTYNYPNNLLKNVRRFICLYFPKKMIKLSILFWLKVRGQTKKWAFD